MKYAVHIFPDIHTCEPISRFRAKYDPLADKIGPHVTLVFPFESDADPQELLEHVQLACIHISPFIIELGHAEHAGNGVIWMPVVNGRVQVKALHHLLHLGAWSRFLSDCHEYIPHVTIGRVDDSNLENSLRDAGLLQGTFTASVEAIVLEEILADGKSSVVGMVNLPSAEN